MDGKIKITYEDGTSDIYPLGVSVSELSKYHASNQENKIIGAKVNNVYKRLDEKVMSSSSIKFIDYTDTDGCAAYKAGLKFVLFVAIKELYGNTSDVIFLNSLDKGMYVEIVGNIDLNVSINDIKNKMQEIVDKDFPIIKQIVRNKDAINYYKSVNYEEKAYNAETSTNMTLTIYKLKNYYNYFYSIMPSSTVVLSKFDLTIIDSKHLVLQYPTSNSNGKIPEYKHYPKTLDAFEHYRNWLNIIKVPYLSDLNHIVSNSDISDFIAMNYIRTENDFFEASKLIYEKNKEHKIRVVFVAGPSSSGKTTTSKKLALHLKAWGLKPIAISCDDFYMEREETPKLPDGTYDFESVDAIDLKLLDNTLNKLMNYEEVQIPTFNFFTGKKEFKNKPIKLSEDSIIVFEGLHCLNDRITKIVDNESQFRVYISPFPGINIDRHNYISSVDLRLLRRMVRDNVYRGYNVEHTMSTWKSVRNGEEKYVFPFQDKADIIINSALIYEVGVLRVFAEPLLASVPVTSMYYEEAKRLLGFVRGFFSINPEYITNDTILREFIGGSKFR